MLDKKTVIVTPSHSSTLVHPPLRSPTAQVEMRPAVRGKFLFVGDEKLYLRGVTYGPFCPDEHGYRYHNPEVAARDFALIAANHINTIRIYTVPPPWLLDVAQQFGLRVLVGIDWEQHITFLDERKRPAQIEAKVRACVRTFAGHPALLGFTIGNEIPAPIVRWYGRRKIERFLRRLYQAAKEEDPEALVTYVNYPTTEYLQLPFLDFVAFNVYLEEQDRLEAYLARLQNITGDKPLVMAEIGLDSHRNGEGTQAISLDRQVRSAFIAGCAGAFIFSWTDEWHSKGQEVSDWAFGLTRRDRSPKPSLEATCRAFVEAPFPAGVPWPKISVVVCSYNGSRTIRETCEGLSRLQYPDYEILVIDDGSTDATAEIAGEYGFRVISTPNQGLSAARNTGLEAASGEIVAYIDDDAYPDPHWPHYLANTFLRRPFVGIGGPNLAPPGDGPIADCVANSPGVPIHILRTDEDAEHIPGCNMAFRKEALRAIGGFDPQFRVAGDDVDICWRLQQQGGTLGFSPAAVVWHHRRNSVRGYLKQQLNYGKAEGLLEQKWPEKYNSFGQIHWEGKLYGDSTSRSPLIRRWRVYHGVWGSRPFQSIYETRPNSLLAMTLMPEWVLVVLVLSVLTAAGTIWPPLFISLPLLILAVLPPLIHALLAGWQASFPTPPRTRFSRFKLCSLTALFHFLQPLSRLVGRVSIGLTPWRRRGVLAYALPRPRTNTIWSKCWQDGVARLAWVESALRAKGAVVLRGNDFERWDLEVRGGLLGAIRVFMTLEEYSEGTQMIRFFSWPKVSPFSIPIVFVFDLVALLALVDQAWIAFGVLGFIAVVLEVIAIGDCAAAMGSWLQTIGKLKMEEEKP